MRYRCWRDETAACEVIRRRKESDRDRECRVEITMQRALGEIERI